MDLSSRLVADLYAETLKGIRVRQGDPTLSAFLQDKPRHMNEPLILDGQRQKPCREISRRACAKRTQTQPVLQLHCMDAAVAFSGQIDVHGIRKHAYLVSNKLKHGSWWPFRRSQWPAGVTQIAKHDRMAKPVVVAAAASDCGQVSG